MKWSMVFFGVLVLLMGTNVHGQSSSSAEHTSLEAENLAVVDAFFKALVEDKDAEAVGEYLSDDFYSHTPSIDGKQGMMDFAANQAENDPGAGFVEIYHSFAHGDTVVRHYSYGSNPEEKADMMIVDFFRVKDGKIVEYWDVISMIDAD